MFKLIRNFFRSPYRYGYTDENGNYVSQADAVLSYIRDHDGCTREDVHKALKIRKASATGRIAELKEQGKIYHSGQVYMPKTDTFNHKLSVQ